MPHIRGTIDFRPGPGGTRMSWEWDVHPPHGTRFLGPLFGWLGRRQEQRVWHALKDYLEDRERPARGPRHGRRLARE